jgi:hypothetical protein
MRSVSVRLAFGSAAALVFAAVLPAATAGTAASAFGRLVPAHQREVLPTRSGTALSLNWAGYAVSRPGISSVASSFTVPTIMGPGVAATWTGIGGYTTTDLIQAGVAEQVPAGLAGPGSYFAWYELLPGNLTPITGCNGDSACTVSAGDQVSVSIANQGGSSWVISIADGSRWTYTKGVTYQSSMSSAEWILEAPQLAVLQTILPLMGDTRFGPTNTFNGQSIASGNPVTIQMVGLGPLAEGQPSPLSGQSFLACPYSLGCPSALPTL